MTSDALDAYYALLPGLVFLAAALVPTIIVESVVALPFCLGRRGLLAVVFVNLVTNPALNVALAAVYGLGLGIWRTGVFVPAIGRAELTTHVAWFFWVVFMALEVAVILIEWALLRWALQCEDLSSRRLLIASTCMNAASAALGLVLSPLVLKV